MKRLLFLVACIMILGLVSSSVWGSIGSGDDAEIVLNFPIDNNIELSNNVLFNCSANITGGAIITNMSLFTNESGIWEAKNTTILDTLFSNAIAYYQLDGNSFVDTTGNGNTLVNTGTTNSTGILIDGRDLSGSGQWVTTPDLHIDGASERTINFWINLDNIGQDGDDVMHTASDVMGLSPYDFGATNWRYVINGITPISGSDATADVGVWTMITMNYNGTHANLFRNGVNMGSNAGTPSGVITAFRIGANVADVTEIDGQIDEIGFWNSTLTDAELLELYNSGNSLKFSGSNSGTQTWTRIISESTLWACGACDSDGDCGLTATNRTIYVDTTLPQITVQSPSGTTDYNYIGGNETLNVTFDDNGLDMCWYNYNGTNITIDGCLTGTSNSTNFTLESDNTNITIYSNDSFGNENSTFINWTYTYLENNRTYNTTSYETAGETFSINVEGASSVTLLYNGTSYTTTKSGNDFTRTLQMPIGKLGNHKIIFSLDETQSSYTSYQNVLEVMFTLCNSSYTTKFLNISFKDETNSSALTASIPTSTFNYYLGDGTVYKTYTYINNTENTNYEFCASPNRILYVDELIQYKSSGYPQRIYDQSAISLSNTITNTILYLLSSIDGIYVTFQVYSGQSAALEGVEVTSTRIIDGSTSIVAQGTTDAAGSVTFWLSPDFSHINTFVLTGYETTILSIFPTQSLYTVTMGGGTASTIIDNAEGVTTTTSPSTTFLDANTFYTFNYTISSSTLTLSEYGMNLTYDNGTVISLQTGSISTGGTLDFSFNTSNNTKLQMSYYYITNSTKINGSTYWLIIETNNYSIYHFFTRISTFISANIFGILGDDDGYFAKAMISILIIIMVTGVISSRYGLGSEAAVTGIMFGIVFMLNLFDMIPNPDFLTLISLGDFLVVFIALLAIGLIIKEETR